MIIYIIIYRKINSFQYMTQTSRGTKMPRGDKEAIMEFEIKVLKI